MKTAIAVALVAATEAVGVEKAHHKHGHHLSQSHTHAHAHSRAHTKQHHHARHHKALAQASVIDLSMADPDVLAQEDSVPGV